MPGFALPDGVFAGWLHYCVFDPLVGLGIILDAKQNTIPHLLCIPCLVMTALAGPLGFATYLVIRTAILVLRKFGILTKTTYTKAAKPGADWDKAGFTGF